MTALSLNPPRSILVAIPEVCTGCRICEIRCAFQHYGQYNPARARIRVARNDEMGSDVPRACRQCTKCPVIAVCPISAVYRDEKTGVVDILKEKCNLCGLCVDACLFHTIFIDATTKRPINCDLCGGAPECVKQCPWQAVQYVPAEQAARLVKPIPPGHPLDTRRTCLKCARPK